MNEEYEYVYVVITGRFKDKQAALKAFWDEKEAHKYAVTELYDPTVTTSVVNKLKLP